MLDVDSVYLYTELYISSERSQVKQRGEALDSTDTIESLPPLLLFCRESSNSRVVGDFPGVPHFAQGEQDVVGVLEFGASNLYDEGELREIVAAGCLIVRCGLFELVGPNGAFLLIDLSRLLDELRWCEAVDGVLGLEKAVRFGVVMLLKRFVITLCDVERTGKGLYQAGDEAVGCPTAETTTDKDRCTQDADNDPDPPP